MTKPKKPPKPKKEDNSIPKENSGDTSGDPIVYQTEDPTEDPIEDQTEDPFSDFGEWGNDMDDTEPTSTDEYEEEGEETVFPPLPGDNTEGDTGGYIPDPGPPPLPITPVVDNVIEYHPDRSYFFIFGQGASGKTVLISSILYFLNTIRSIEYRDTLKNLNNPDLKHEQEGNKLWKELSQTIFTKKFPRGTTTVQNQNPIPRHINAHFKPSSNSPEFKFCLMDMAGEDLEKVDYDSTQSLPSSIVTYIKELPKENMCFIYVLNPDDQYFSNEKKLGLFQAFINTLDANEHTNTPLLLLVTKWDTIKDKYANAEDFVKKEFSPIWGTLNQNERKITIGKFSIGEVIGDNPTATNFENFDSTYPERVFKWMYKTQIGINLDNETEKEKSFFEKILDFFK
jgi:GTPase SAR1 family protein